MTNGNKSHSVGYWFSDSFHPYWYHALLLKQKQRLQKEITSRETEIVRVSGMVAKHLYREGRVVDKIILRERFSHTVCTGRIS